MTSDTHDAQLDRLIEDLWRRAQSQADNSATHQVLTLLIELRDRRAESDAHVLQLAELGRALHSCRQELHRMHHATSATPDQHVRVRVEISQDLKRWQAARVITAETIQAYGWVGVVPAMARRVAEEAAHGFLEEVLT